MNFVPSTLIISLAAFLVLYYFLQKYAFGPLFGMMEKRQVHITEQIQTAEKNRQQSELLLIEQKQAIQDARKEAYDILEQARATSSRQADEFIQQSKAEAARLKEEALKEIENEKNKAVAALRGQVSSMAVMIASKIIEKQVDEKSQEQLIGQYLKEVGGNL